MDNNSVTLLQISEELGEKDVLGMIFLCGKNIKEGDKENITDGKKLFSYMKMKGLLSKENLLFLKELLIRIGRRDILADKLRTTRTEMEELERSFNHVSPYRSLLYDITVNLNSEETEKILFVLEDEIKHMTRLNESKCMMMVFSEMEKQGKLSEDYLQILKTILLNISRPDLSNKIEKFENEQYIRRLDLNTKFEKISIQDESGGDIKECSTQPDIENESPSMDNQEEYKLDKRPHGWCIIVNNHNFNETAKNRNGTEKDGGAITGVFSSRDYEVKQHDNLTGDEMLNIMKTYAKEDHTEKDSFVCFVLSHGDKGIVYGTDGKEVFVKDLTDQFNGLNCPSLIGKPKVFFIQACQGNKSDTGVTYVSDSNASVYVKDACGQSIPITADFLTAFASVEDYEALRNLKTGSVFIQNLCTVLQDHQFFKKDLIYILTKVQDKTSKETYTVKKSGKTENVKQMPTLQSTLRKVLVLPPPSNEQQAN